MKSNKYDEVHLYPVGRIIDVSEFDNEMIDSMFVSQEYSEIVKY